MRDSRINSKEKIETKGLEQLIKTTGNPNDASELVKKLDKLTKCSKNNILVWKDKCKCIPARKSVSEI